jgi:hypothetical protein
MRPTRSSAWPACNQVMPLFRPVTKTSAITLANVAKIILPGRSGNRMFVNRQLASTPTTVEMTASSAKRGQT